MLLKKKRHGEKWTVMFKKWSLRRGGYSIFPFAVARSFGEQGARNQVRRIISFTFHERLFYTRLL